MGEVRLNEMGDEDDILDMSLGDILDLLIELRAEVDRQREVDGLWESNDQWNLERLKLELRILHAIVEGDERLEDFRKARGLLFLD